MGWTRGLLLLAALFASCIHELQADAAPDAAQVVKVATSAALKRALDSGAAHVHITAHLDLRDITPAPPDESSTVSRYFDVDEQLQTLTVRNVAIVSASDPEPLLAKARVPFCELTTGPTVCFRRRQR